MTGDFFPLGHCPAHGDHGLVVCPNCHPTGSPAAVARDVLHDAVVTMAEHAPAAWITGFVEGVLEALEPTLPSVQEVPAR